MELSKELDKYNRLFQTRLYGDVGMDVPAEAEDEPVEAEAEDEVEYEEE
jgi:hypothetical protein